MTPHATPPVLSIPGATPELAGRLSDGLDRVDALLREVVDHDDPFIAKASGHLVEAGGKRFRPLLTLLAAELAGGINDDVVRAAAGVELTHLASLYHDDVMDEAQLRRGVPSANVVYDNSTAILVGDLLFGKASELVAGLGAEAVLIQAQTFVRLCCGSDPRRPGSEPTGVDPVDYYLDVLADKTGVLIATAGRYGVMFAGGDEATAMLMRDYGEKVGIAFQLADDLIDIASDADESGKTPGTDLREGVDTLAVLRAKDSTDPADARLLELLARRPRPTTTRASPRRWRCCALHPALEQAREETYAVAREARPCSTRSRRVTPRRPAGPRPLRRRPRRLTHRSPSHPPSVESSAHVPRRGSERDGALDRAPSRRVLRRVAGWRPRGPGLSVRAVGCGACPVVCLRPSPHASRPPRATSRPRRRRRPRRVRRQRRTLVGRSHGLPIRIATKSLR